MNLRRGNIDLKEGRVKYARNALNHDMIEKKFQSLKHEIAILKKGSSDPENIDVDIDAPSVDEILAKPIPNQF